MSAERTRMDTGGGGDGDDEAAPASRQRVIEDRGLRRFVPDPAAGDARPQQHVRQRQRHGDAVASEGRPDAGGAATSNGDGDGGGGGAILDPRRAAGLATGAGRSVKHYANAPLELVQWRKLHALRAEVERAHADFLTDPRFDVDNNRDEFDVAAYLEKMSAMQGDMLARPPTVALSWHALSVEVPVEYGAPGEAGIETVGSQLRELLFAVPGQLLDACYRLRRRLTRTAVRGAAEADRGEQAQAQLPGGRRRRALEPIVDDASGYLLPGEMLLVLGPPGSGTSTFLSVLARRNLSDYARITGDVFFNGHPLGAEARARLQHILQFVEEEDVHVANLTVRQTFEFAAECVVPDFAPYAEKLRADRVKLIASYLGLTHVMDTVVGNDLLRGVSGGEKKRVTIGETAARMSSQVWLLDQWSRGLDAAASADLMERVAQMGQVRRTTVISVMQQASQHIYDMYDKVMIMEAGKVLYFGPTAHAERYFYELGFERPPERLVPEFLATLGDPREAARCVRGNVRERSVPRTAQQFADAYKRSALARAYRDELASGRYLSEEQRAAFSVERYVEMGKLFQRDSLQRRSRQVAMCLMREARMRLLDRFSLAVRFMRYLVLGLVIGALFWRMPTTATGATTRNGLLFLLLLTVSVGNFAQIQELFNMLQVFRKQRRAGFYEALPYFFAQWIVDVPMVFLESLLFVTIVYFMTGLSTVDGGKRYGYALLVIWTAAVAVNMMFKAVAYLTPYVDIAFIIGSVLVVLMVLSTGFLLAPSAIPPFLIWVYWLNPLHYAYEGLMLNEYAGQQFRCTPSELQPPGVPPASQVCSVGDGLAYVHRAFGFSTAPQWKWVMFGALVCFVLGLTAIAALALLYARFPPRPMYKTAGMEAAEADVRGFQERCSAEKSSGGRRRGRRAARSGSSDGG